MFANWRWKTVTWLLQTFVVSLCWVLLSFSSPCMHYRNEVTKTMRTCSVTYQTHDSWETISALGWCSLFKCNWRDVDAMWFILHVLTSTNMFTQWNLCCISKSTMTYQPKSKWKLDQFSCSYGYQKCMLLESLIGIRESSQSCSLLSVE